MRGERRRAHPQAVRSRPLGPFPLTFREKSRTRRHPMSQKTVPASAGTTRAKYVYSFGGGTAEGNGQTEGPPRRQGSEPRRDGEHRPPRPARFHHHHRGLHLLLRPRQELPEGAREGQVAAHLARVEKQLGKRFGDPKNPLLVSVRSGARASMPGMMDTVLNLGLNDATVEGLAADLGQRALRLGLLPPLRRDVRRRGPRPQAGRARTSTTRSR